MNEEIRERLKKDLIERCPDCPTDDVDLFESLTDKHPVWESERDDHRWWACVDRVTEIGDMYVRYAWAITTGDDSAEDKGWEFDPESIVQVYPRKRQVLVTDYVTYKS